MEVEVSIDLLLGGSPRLTRFLPSSDWRLCTETPPVWKRLFGAAAAAFNLSWVKQEAATCGYTVEWCSPGGKGPCALQWMKVPAGGNMLSLPAGTFFFAVIQSQDYFSWLQPFHGSLFQGISRLAADLHSTSMDAQKMDTSCWRSRLVIHKSSVSVEAPGSRRLPPADALTLENVSVFLKSTSQNQWRLQIRLHLQVSPHL